MPRKICSGKVKDYWKVSDCGKKAPKNIQIVVTNELVVQQIMYFEYDVYTACYF